MALPIVGGDHDTWGDKLNSHLTQMQGDIDKMLAVADADATVAGYIDDPGTATSAQLNADYARVIQVASDGSADQAARINAALARGSAFGSRRTVRLVGDFNISDSLVVHSGTVLDAREATITLDPTANVNILKNLAVDTIQRTVTDAAMTSGSATLTSATAAFTSADVGRSITVEGANVGGLRLVANITAVTDTATATLSVPAGATVSAATARLRDRDTDITLLGGLWTKFTTSALAVGQRNTQAHAIFLRHLDRVTILYPQVQTSDNARYAITLGDVTAFKVHGPYFPTAKSDGVHITGPARGGSIRDATGYTGDDMVALCTTENNFFDDVAGSISDVLTDSSKKYGTATVGNAFKLAGYPGLRHDRIEARDLYVENPNAWALALAVDTGGLDIGTLWVDGAHGAAYITGGTVKNLTVRNARHGGTVASQPWFNIQNDTVIDHLTIDGLACESALSGQFPVLVQDSASVKRLFVRDVDWKAEDTYLVKVQETANVTLLHLVDASLDSTNNGGGVVNQVNTATIGTIKLDNVQALKGAWCVALEGTTTTTLHMNAVKAGANGPFYLSATAVLNVYGNARFDSGTANVTAGGNLSVRSLDVPVDVSKLTRYLGDMAWNNNNSLACGSGPVVCDGTSWKHLYTGLTYTP